MNWERAIIIGNTRETYFATSSYDELLLRKNNSNTFLNIGDCIKCTSRSTTGWQMGDGKIEMRRVVDKFEKIDRFVDLKLQNQNRGVYIMGNILGVDLREHPRTRELVRCFRTDFLEEVYDDVQSKTRIYKNEELIGMKVIASHIVTPLKYGYWAVINVNNDPNDTFDRNGRHFRRGIALNFRMENTKNGKHDLMFWIPHVRERALYTEELRGNIPKQRFFGNWVSFSLNRNYQVDEQSDVKIIEDVLPTRIHQNRCEVRVSVRFEIERWDKRGYPELKCSQCGGLVADITRTLEQYGMLKSLSGEAWVQYFQHEPSRGIWFILSEKQDEWIDDNRIDRTRENPNENSSRRRSRSPERSNYRDNFDSRNSGREDDYGRRERSRPREEDRRENPNENSSRRRSRSSERSDYRENYERSRPREDFDIVDQRNREYERRLRETSRAPSRIDRSPSRKRDDTSSIPSTSRSYNDDLSKAQANLKKLKTRYEYLTANNMPIPEKLREDLGNAILEEQISRYDFDDRKSGKIEVDAGEFNKYKELATLFRGMLSSSKVCDEMRKYDANLLNNINRLMFDS
ncbi:unnamed protein product [Caenorhabditis angaria]|uniref:Uncharacterized protein n=1 Tax=Caenorhabditis angaria TaxID=860376 RepID=A0A9P1IPJ1_9PELO|nr:unnamed protein product [Caenorhabditis angaria]